MLRYIEKYGDLDFIQKPFNEIDSLIFSQLIYNDFKDVIGDKDILTLSEAAERFYAIHDNVYLDSLIDVAKRASKLLTVCSESKRFGSVIVSDYIDNVNDSIDKQIAACSFLLTDDSLLISFRGTDASVAGFKESAMLAYMFPIPAQIEALHYFQETAMMHDGYVRLCGHSKGGNLAIYASVNCSNSLQRKISGVYAFDSPGFPEWFFSRHDYELMDSRIYLYAPQGSLVGRALYSAKQPEIVVSYAKHSRQHSVSTWEIVDDKFVTTDSFTAESDKMSAYLNDLVVYIGDKDLEVFYDALEQTANELGISDFYDLKKVDVSLLTIFVDSIQTLTPEQKERFRALAKKVMTDVAKGYASDAASKAKGYVKNIAEKLPFMKKSETEGEKNEKEKQDGE
ncbi:MAG: DUF2974 domain-containing protein [Eubacterium sp.]|nr:DUF2974 domain-containing protein [Eubacterium sp.]